MPEPACPSCGEDEALLGRPADGDIEITCQRCGAEWMRGEPRCKACGLSGGTTVPQRMTRQPRGTLLAVVGVRDVPLCSNCDCEVISAAVEKKQPVPEGYVSRFLFGEVVDRLPDASTPRPSATPKSRPTSSSKPVAASRLTRPGPAPPPVDPTVRQATEVFLNDAGEPSDSLAMVLLGTKLGAATRLSRLDVAETVTDLASWVDQTFRERPDQRRQTVTTLQRAFAYWHAKGWLTHDFSAGMK